MKKSINQGTTLFVVSGSRKENATFNLLYVNKKIVEYIEEEHFYSKNISIEQIAQSEEDIEKLDDVSKLMAKNRGLNRTIYVAEQGIKKIMKPHLVVYDRKNKRYDIDEPNETNLKYFRSRKSAKKYYRKLKKNKKTIFFDEYGTHLN